MILNAMGRSTITGTCKNLMFDSNSIRLSYAKNFHEEASFIYVVTCIATG